MRRLAAALACGVLAAALPATSGAHDAEAPHLLGQIGGAALDVASEVRRIDAELAGANLEFMIERMRAGRTLQQIELEEQADAEPVFYEAQFLAAA